MYCAIHFGKRTFSNKVTSYVLAVGGGGPGGGPGGANGGTGWELFTKTFCGEIVGAHDIL